MWLLKWYGCVTANDKSWLTYTESVMPYIGCSESTTDLNQHCQCATVIWRAYFQNENQTVSTFSKSSFFLRSSRTSAFCFLRASSNFWKYHASYTAPDSISRSRCSRTTHLSVHNALNIPYYWYNHYKSFYTPSETLVCVIPKHIDTKS